MKRIKNLYVGDIYNRCWFENKKSSAVTMVAHGGVKLTKLKSAHLYKTNDEKYVVVDELLDKPFANIRIHLAVLTNNKLNSIALSDVEKETEQYGPDGTLGNFVDENSLKKVI